MTALREDTVPCLLGPTAVGKSDVALHLARASGSAVLQCDAFAVYRGMEVLSAAPLAPPDVPHHLVAFLDPSESYSAARFVEDADRLTASRPPPWVVCGTALYLRSWLKGIGAKVARDEGLRSRLEEVARREGPGALHRRLLAADPERAAQIHPNDERRLVRALEIVEGTGRAASLQRNEWTGPDRVPATLYGLERSGGDLDARILARVESMFEHGVVEEARLLLARPLSPEARKALGLDELASLLAGETTRAEAVATIAQKTRRFAKKQTTFFRSFERVRWVRVEEGEPAEETARRVLAAQE